MPLTLKDLLLFELKHPDHSDEIKIALTAGRIRVVRHVMNMSSWQGFDEKLRFDKELLEVFTAHQVNDLYFQNEQLLLVFVGAPQGGALLRGAFKCGGRLTSEQFSEKYGAVYEGYRQFLADIQDQAQSYIYNNLERLNVLEDLWDRLVIEWPGGPAWVQGQLDKQVREIKPRGFVRPFPNWDEVFITHQELQAIIENPEANDDWFQFLSQHHGVYTILDTQSNGLYVGSAYGFQGLWGRWSGYARSGHNDNIGLLNLFRNEFGTVDIQSRASYFRYSINHVFAKGTKTPTQIINYETLAKRKLGSSLNHN
jgi:hypothetical protein